MWTHIFKPKSCTSANFVQCKFTNEAFIISQKSPQNMLEKQTQTIEALLRS